MYNCIYRRGNVFSLDIHEVTDSAIFASSRCLIQKDGSSDFAIRWVKYDVRNCAFVSLSENYNTLFFGNREAFVINKGHFCSIF